MARKTPWARIVYACEKGTGVSLSADDVRDLNFEAAKSLRAALAQGETT